MKIEKDPHQLGLEQGINIGRSQAKQEFIDAVEKFIKRLKEKLDEWNYLGTEREPVSYGKRMRFKDTNKKVFNIGRKDMKEIKEFIDEFAGESLLKEVDGK